MKKIILCSAALLISAAAIVAVSTSNRLEKHLETNVDALAQNEGNLPASKCYGPRKTNFWGKLFCHCENMIPCVDKYGCN